MFRKAVLAASLPFLFSLSARADVSADLFNQVRDLTIKCVVQPVTVDRTGRRVYGQPRSTCIELQAAGPRARLWLGRIQLDAVLTVSEHADGGDLNHLFLYSAGRPVAQLRDVAAFGNILVALAGGRTEFKVVPGP